MSCEWGYRCNTCSEDSDTWLNWGQDTLRRLYQSQDIIKALTKPDLRWTITVSVFGYGEEPIDFLRVHTGHELVLHNEYGDIEPI